MIHTGVIGDLLYMANLIFKQQQKNIEPYSNNIVHHRITHSHNPPTHT